MKLVIRTLGEICDAVGGIIRTGPFGSQLHDSDYIDDGIPVVMPKNIVSGKISIEDIAHIAESDAQRLAQHQLHIGDIVYGRRGDIGRRALITERENGYLCGTGCLRISLGKKIVDPVFLYYYLGQSEVTSWIASRAIGATLPNLNTSILRSVEVVYPVLKVQQKIASILLAYDDLIENNTRRIAILEEMARMLYQEWFVKFRFPGHEDVKMVESEMGMIPEGWHVGEFGQLANLVRRTINPDKFKDETVVHYSLPAFDAGQMPIVEPGENIKSSKFLVPNGAILLSKLNPHIPRIWLPIDSTSPFVVASTEFLVLLPKNSSSRELIFCCCCSQGFMDRFISKAIGTSTSHQRVKPENLMNTEIVRPDPEIVRKFTAIAESLFKNLHNLRLRNANLRRTRDLLLPKLISGEIDVSSWIEGEMEAEEPLAVAAKDLAVVRERVPDTPIDVGSLEQHSLWG